LRKELKKEKIKPSVGEEESITLMNPAMVEMKEKIKNKNVLT